MKSVVTLRYMTERDREGELGESMSKEACGDKGSDMKLNQTTPPTMTEQILRRKWFLLVYFEHISEPVLLLLLE